MPQGPRLQHHPFFDLGRAGERRLQRGVELVEGDLREEAQAPEIHPRDRHIGIRAGNAPGHPDQCSVTTEKHDQVARGGQRIGGRGAGLLQARQPRCCRLEHHVHVACLEPGGKLREHACRCLDVVLGDEPDSRYA